MKDEEKALVLRKEGAVTGKCSGSKAILNRMVSDAVALANSSKSSLSAACFTIGVYEFREIDYRQIVRWAEQLDLLPEEVVERLQQSIYSFEDKDISFEVQDGSIISLVIDYKRLPLIDFTSDKRLLISKIAFTGRLDQVIPTIKLELRLLEFLACNGINLRELDLSNVPLLTTLVCSWNELDVIDLANVPSLTTLECSCNFGALKKLDLENVPALITLSCAYNSLTKLDLSKVPQLTTLYCRFNYLTEIDLSNVPLLTELICNDNQLTELDISNVPSLIELHCEVNALTELDLSKVPLLTELWCYENPLEELDISALKNLVTLDGETPDEYYNEEYSEDYYDNY
jgi:hypothetical protein